MSVVKRLSVKQNGHALVKFLGALCLGVILIFVGFSWGMATIEKKIFPFKYIRDADDQAIGKERAPANALWAKRLMAGGYILHFRHAQREKWNDVTGFDAYELKNGIDASQASFYKAVCLTPQGEEEAKLMRAAFEMAGVKVGKVVSSPSCRARQTSMIAFGRIDAIENSLLHRTAIRQDQHVGAAKRLRKAIEALTPAKGRKDVLIGHVNTLRYDGDLVIDVNNLPEDIDNRDETGFVVIEKKDGKLIAQHSFKSIFEFVNATVALPVD